MEAGKELDDLIATQVMGWHKGIGGPINAGKGYEVPEYWYDADGKQHAPRVKDVFANLYPWSPSTEWGAAGQVVDHLRTKGIGIELTIYPDGVCMYWVLRRTEGDRFEHFEDGQVDTAMLAICHAALDVKED